MGSPWSGDNLQLSTGQKQQFSQLESEARTQHMTLYKQLHDLRGQLSAVYREFQLDVKKARSLNDQLNKVQAQLLDLHLIEQQKLRRILTPDQFSRLQAQVDQQRDEERRRHGPGEHEWPH
jgi:Spy/CpxP family protein refolding chaperone